jgi:phosphoglycerate dehydrogenase-like enzyme
MTDRPRVLVCDSLHPDGIELLQQKADVDLLPDLTTREIQERIGHYHGLVVGPRRRITHDIIEEGLNLRVIGCAGPRLDNIDVTTARAMGIEVRTNPGSNAVAIAEHTLTLMLRLAMQGTGARRLSGQTLGIIGFGLIGRQVARRALAFDMNVIVNQPRLTPELALDAGVAVTDFVELLRRADFVSLHVPFKAETETLIGATELQEMKPSAYLINTGHTDLVDDAALLQGLDEGWLAGAAVPEYPSQIERPHGEESDLVRQHERVIVAPHVTAIIGDRRREASISVAQQVLKLLRVKRPSETLSLELVPIEQVMPHEEIDEKRVKRLMERLREEAKLINPPIVTRWDNNYVILDGATRFTALKRLGYPHIIVQVVDPHRDDFDLHTWYHVISSDKPVEDLFTHLQAIDGLRFTSLPAEDVQSAFRERGALCYLLDHDGNATLIQVEDKSRRLRLMNQLVSCYTKWGVVERTLLTELSRLKGQFPDLKALAVFPQFEPETVFEQASHGKLLPAGLTRFVIPGRILRLNADLEQLKADEPLATKRAWFNQFLAEKLARSRLRYYQEPVILLDE